MAIPVIVWLVGLAAGCTMGNPLYAARSDGDAGESEGESEAEAEDDAGHVAQRSYAAYIEANESSGSLHLLNLPDFTPRGDAVTSTDPNAIVRAFEDSFYVVNHESHRLQIINPSNRDVSTISTSDAQPTDVSVINGFPYVGLQNGKVGRINPVSRMMDVQIDLHTDHASSMTVAGGKIYIDAGRYLSVVNPDTLTSDIVLYPSEQLPVQEGNRIDMAASSDGKVIYIDTDSPHSGDNSSAGLLVGYYSDPQRWYGGGFNPNYTNLTATDRACGAIEDGPQSLYTVYNFRHRGEMSNLCSSQVYAINHGAEGDWSSSTNVYTSEDEIASNICEARAGISDIAWSQSTNTLLIADRHIEDPHITVIAPNGRLRHTIRTSGPPTSLASF